MLIYVGEGDFIPGVPARDLDESDLRRLSESRINDILETGLYNEETESNITNEDIEEE